MSVSGARYDYRHLCGHHLAGCPADYDVPWTVHRRSRHYYRYHSHYHHHLRLNPGQRALRCRYWH